MGLSLTIMASHKLLQVTFWGKGNPSLKPVCLNHKHKLHLLHAKDIKSLWKIILLMSIKYYLSNNAPEVLNLQNKFCCSLVK